MLTFKQAALAAAVGLLALSAQAAPVAGQGTWESTLKARDIDGQAVALNDTSAVFFYDSTLNITWLRDMHMNGAANWAISNQWAQNLVVGGFSDWRLPHTFDSGAAGCDWSDGGGTDCGYNTATSDNGVASELAHLFYVTLGNLAAYAPGTGFYRGGSAGVNWGLVNTAYFDFSNAGLAVDPGSYWTDLLVQGPPDEDAYFFRFRDGAMRPGGNGIQDMLAVRDGDVLNAGGGGGSGSGSTVPEPASLALAALALAGLAGRRRPARHGPVSPGAARPPAPHD